METVRSNEIIGEAPLIGVVNPARPATTEFLSASVGSFRCLRFLKNISAAGFAAETEALGTGSDEVGGAVESLQPAIETSAIARNADRTARQDRDSV
ncbi:MAG: hypothetical protein DCC49_12100 [Acidobacteria bacterium]|nr:MAG: hypothetical protein DCC49_12100 [Acidobacteriota bacterium]